MGDSETQREWEIDVNLPPDDKHRELYRAVRNHPRVCARCFRLVREVVDEPSEAWSENRRKGIIDSPLIAGPRDREAIVFDPDPSEGEATSYKRYEESTEAVTGYRDRAGTEAGAWNCECGALNTTTPRQSGDSLNKWDTVRLVIRFSNAYFQLNRAGELPDGIETPAHSGIACFVLGGESAWSPDLTNTAIDDLMPALLKHSIARKREDRRGVVDRSTETPTVDSR